jgi:hypothetical protein
MQPRPQRTARILSEQRPTPKRRPCFDGQLPEQPADLAADRLGPIRHRYLARPVGGQSRLARSTFARSGAKMKSTAPLSYALAFSVSSRPKAVRKMIGVSADCSRSRISLAVS